MAARPGRTSRRIPLMERQGFLGPFPVLCQQLAVCSSHGHYDGAAATIFRQSLFGFSRADLKLPSALQASSRASGSRLPEGRL